MQMDLDGLLESYFADSSKGRDKRDKREKNHLR